MKDLANHFKRDSMTLSYGIRERELGMIKRKPMKKLITEVGRNLVIS